MVERCETCGKRFCLRFGTLAPGYPCGMGHYASFLWFIPLMALGLLVMLLWNTVKLPWLIFRKDEVHHD